jgi:membrane-associated phospholipid phosphatase
VRGVEVIGSTDRACQRLAHRSRHLGPFDRLMYLLSAAGDDGKVWFAAIALEARRRDDPRAVAVRALLALGVESVIVNGPLKSATKRERPDRSAVGFRATRIPHNSSFPSGHAASSACMATVLSDSSPLAPLWWSLAAGIAWSRVHIGAHHASDVLGGLVIGTAVGLAARRIAPLPAEV